MPETIRLSLDAMGGDHAPASVVNGAALALKRLPNLTFLMFGDEAKVKPLLDAHPKLAAVTELRHTDSFVTMEDKPSVALRKGRNSSMRLAINAVKTGEADGMVSAGNTGALMVMSKLVLKTVPGIDRPAFTTSFPTRRGQCVMLDLGANVDCDANNLVQFAVMGEVFSRTLLGIPEPSVGLLNIGIEEVKGNEEVKAAAAILRDTDLPIRFHGFVEGDDIALGTVDVVVTDGFTGNVALKVAEGTSRFITHMLRETFRSTLWAKLGYLLAGNAMNRLRKRLDPRRYNGALLLGVNGIAIKGHGSSDDLGFSNAISVCHELVANRLNDRIIEELETFNATQSTLNDSLPNKAAI